MDFIDTSAWFTYFLPNDPDHLRVRECLQTRQGVLLTTDYCVDETLTLLMARGELRRAEAAGKAFFEEQIIRLHYLSPDQILAAWLLFQTRAAQGWSFTDCTSKIVIDHLKPEAAITLDSHFRQFGIEVLP